MAENATTPGPIEHSAPIRDDDEQAIRSSLELWTKQRNEIERLRNELHNERDSKAALRSDAAEKIAALEARVEAFIGERESLESRVRSAVLERDAARDREGLWAAFFAAIRIQFEGFDPVTLNPASIGTLQRAERERYQPLRGAEHEGDKKGEAAA